MYKIFIDYFTYYEFRVINLNGELFFICFLFRFIESTTLRIPNLWTLPRICRDSKFQFGNASPQGIRSLFIDGCAHLWLSHCSYRHLFCHVVMFLAIAVSICTTTIKGDLFLPFHKYKLELQINFCIFLTTPTDFRTF